MATIPLPRQINSADPQELMEVIRQLVNFVHSLPRFEIKTVRSSQEVSHTFSTDIDNPKVVLVGQAYKTNNVDESLSVEGLPDWRPVEGGIKHRIDTSGVNHTFHYLIIGEGR